MLGAEGSPPSAISVRTFERGHSHTVQSSGLFAALVQVVTKTIDNRARNVPIIYAKTRDGTGRDSAGISRPVPATKTRDETSVLDTETRDPGRDIDVDNLGAGQEIRVATSPIGTDERLLYATASPSLCW